MAVSVSFTGLWSRMLSRKLTVWFLQCTQHLSSIPVVLRPPQALRGEARSLYQGFELGPHDGRVLALVQRPLGKPTVSPRDDPLPAHHPCKVHDALCHCFGMLDYGSGMRDDAGDKHLALRERDVLPQAPLIRVTGRGCLHRV